MFLRALMCFVQGETVHAHCGSQDARLCTENNRCVHENRYVAAACQSATFILRQQPLEVFRPPFPNTKFWLLYCRSSELPYMSMLLCWHLGQMGFEGTRAIHDLTQVRTFILFLCFSCLIPSACGAATKIQILSYSVSRLILWKFQKAYQRKHAQKYK